MTSDCKVLATLASVALLMGAAGCSLRPETAVRIEPGLNPVPAVAGEAGGTVTAAADGTAQAGRREGGDHIEAGRSAVESLPPFAGSEPGLTIGGLSLPTGTIRINAEQMELPRFVHYALGETLGLSYSLDEQVRARQDAVTLYMTEALSAGEFLDVVRGLLGERGVSLVPRQGVVQVSAARRDAPLPVGMVRIGRDTPPAVGGRLLQVVPIHHVNPIVMKNMLEQDVLLDASVELMQQSSNLLLRGDADEVEQAVRYIRLIDRPALAGRRPLLITLEHVGAEALTEDLRRVLVAEGVAVAAESFQQGVLLVPLSGGRQLFAAVPDVAVERHLTALVERLDRPAPRADGGRLYVYTPENRDAGELAEVVGMLIERAAADSSPAATEATTERPALSRRVVVDKGRNSLLIQTGEAEYHSLLGTLRALDTPPRQIFVEVTIAEVTLDDQLQFGVEWFLRKQSGDFTTTLQTLGGLGVGSAGAVFAIGKASGDLSAVINALGKDRQVKILSRPRLMLHDNGTASINVGTEVPVITSEATSADLNLEGSSALLRSVQYRSTGVGLDISARILSKNLVSLSVNQRVSEAQANNTSTIDSPIILERSLATEVEVRSGRSVLLGGLMSENESFEESKVPLMGDLPLLGGLFRSQSRGRTRTELLIQLQPVIVVQEETGERLLEQLEQSLSKIR